MQYKGAECQLCSGVLRVFLGLGIGENEGEDCPITGEMGFGDAWIEVGGDFRDGGVRGGETGLKASNGAARQWVGST